MAMAVAATRPFRYLGRVVEPGEVLDPTPDADLSRRLVDQRRARYVAPEPEPTKSAGRRRPTT